MPSASGVYSLPAGYLAVTGQTIQASQHNPTLEDIAQALTNRLSRDGTAPMTGALKAVDGTVGAPAITFASDPSLGLFKTQNGIGVSVSGVKSAEFVAGGINGALFVGMLFPYTCTAPPNNLFVLPFGQTLSRTAFAALFAQAQIEIAAGNTFYNNGDGATTFGIGDMRGRVPVGWDKMGGSAANRVTTAGSGVDGSTIGAVGGAQNKTLLTTNLPPYTPSGSVSNGAITVNGSAAAVSSSTTPGGAFPCGGNSTSFTATQAASSFSGTAQGGTSTPVTNMPPSMVTNYILFAGA